MNPIFAAGAVGHDRTLWLSYGTLIAATALAWWRTIMRPMSAGDMAGMGMTMAPSFGDAVSYVTAWAVMMAAMMLPSALPMIALFAATRRTASPGARLAAVTLFSLVYLLVWALTGVPIYLASLPLMAVQASTLAWIMAAVLVAAGLFQFSSLKRVCLRHCRSPLGFLLARGRAGWRGALLLGWDHAVYCLGCCWALMVVLVVAGAMGLPWVLLIACLVAAEKVLPRGEWIARIVGVALVLAGLAVALRPGLAAPLRGM